MRWMLDRPGRTPFLLIAAACQLAVTSAAQGAVVEGDQATFAWPPASGPVAGYAVFVIRNDVTAPSPEIMVSDTTATISSDYNDTISVRVAAFDSAGNQGPMSATSETVLLAAPPRPPAPDQVIVDADTDYSILTALAGAAAGEQVVIRMRGGGKQLLDAANPEESEPGSQAWGLDQLVVGTPELPTIVRLIDAMGLNGETPLADLPEVTLFGLGSGPPCARDGGQPGLVIAAGSRLVLGGLDLHVFDGETCIHVNELFAGSPDPNVVMFGEGEIQLFGDLEDDGILDPADNCMAVANESQCDVDGDGFGNACDFDSNDDGAVALDDVAIVMEAGRQVSNDPIVDFNCDGAVGLDDLSAMLPYVGAPLGPSGLACAVDASCGGRR